MKQIWTNANIHSVIKTQISNLVHTTGFCGITLINYDHDQKIGKPNNFIVFGDKEPKGSKDGNQIRLRSHIHEGEEPWFY